MDGYAAFGGIKPLAVATRKGKGLSREKQSPKKKFTKAEVAKGFLDSFQTKE